MVEYSHTALLVVVVVRLVPGPVHPIQWRAVRPAELVLLSRETEAVEADEEVVVRVFAQLKHQ